MPRLPSFEQWRQEPFLTGRLSWGLYWLDLFGLGIDSPFHYHSLHGVYNRVLATVHLMTRRPKSCQCLNADEKKNSQLTENAGATECNLAIFCCDWLVSWIHQPPLWQSCRAWMIQKHWRHHADNLDNPKSFPLARRNFLTPLQV